MRTPTILIADDDRHLRESLHEFLADLGCDIAEAGNGLDAIALLTSKRCDLLLSDVDMPDMTGFQLLSWVTDQGRIQSPNRSSSMLNPAMKVVLMSARADQHLGREAQRAGAITLLSKPVELPAITSLVHSLLEH
jgi:CheY-like chemotaxis protein